MTASSGSGPGDAHDAGAGDGTISSPDGGSHTGTTSDTGTANDAYEEREFDAAADADASRE
jgi:hypothetical protein